MFREKLGFWLLKKRFQEKPKTETIVHEHQSEILDLQSEIAILRKNMKRLNSSVARGFDNDDQPSELQSILDGLGVSQEELAPLIQQFLQKKQNPQKTAMEELFSGDNVL